MQQKCCLSKHRKSHIRSKSSAILTDLFFSSKTTRKKPKLHQGCWMLKRWKRFVSPSKLASLIPQFLKSGLASKSFIQASSKWSKILLWGSFISQMMKWQDSRRSGTKSWPNCRNQWCAWQVWVSTLSCRLWIKMWFFRTTIPGRYLKSKTQDSTTTSWG